MASSQGNELLEERLRKMILTNDPVRSEPGMTSNQPVPVVRLPQRQQYPHQQTQSTTSQSRFQPQTNVQHQTQATARSFDQRQQPNFRHGQQPRGYSNDARINHQWRQSNTPVMQTNSYNRNQSYSNQNRPAEHRQLYQPMMHQTIPPHIQQQLKAQYIESILAREIPLVEMTQEERSQKEEFRAKLQQVCHELCAADPERLPAVDLHCFGSFQSGFASAGSDMDLVIVPRVETASVAQFSLLEHDLPRRLELRLLQSGYGARLLTRTRVPIIKVCELPSTSFLDQLREERWKWDQLTNEEKYPHLSRDDEENELEATTIIEEDSEQKASTVAVESNPKAINVEEIGRETPIIPETDIQTVAEAAPNTTNVGADAPSNSAAPEVGQATVKQRTASRQDGKKWERERKAGPLDFPKDGVGIHSDINFFNPLGLHNTHMLRCYSLCDQRVRPMILFVKAWAKKRKINSSYSGTLSSYGYVLMVLHYLVNVARPPVLPNLQLPWRPHADCTPQGADRTQVDEWVVDFWRREEEIINVASQGMLTTNRESLGSLLAGFFRYYASQSGGFSFHWMQQVLSLRTPGGILTKETKGWVKARTEEGEGRKVQYRYLFCIEDPFELEHNVARTVTHYGIVAIRDEFRRAGHILLDVANRQPLANGELFDDLIEPSADHPTGEGKQQADVKLDTQDVAAFPAIVSAQSKVVDTNKRTTQGPKAKQTSKTSKDTPQASKNNQAKGPTQASKPLQTMETAQSGIPIQTTGIAQASRPVQTPGTAQASRPVQTPGTAQASRPVQTPGTAQASKSIQTTKNTSAGNAQDDTVDDSKSAATESNNVDKTRRRPHRRPQRKIVNLDSL